LRILITNLFVANFSGSETVVELLADALSRAGHAPMIFAPTLGLQAERMQARGHIVVDRLAMLPQRPDVMHLQHITPALMALVAFPDVPAVFTCHSATIEVEAPLYTHAIGDAVAQDISHAAATAIWLEDLLPSAAERAWLDVARETGLSLEACFGRRRAARLRSLLRSLPFPIRSRLQRWRQ
jgi:hypothetical protein